MHDTVVNSRWHFQNFMGDTSVLVFFTKSLNDL